MFYNIKLYKSVLIILSYLLIQYPFALDGEENLEENLYNKYVFVKGGKFWMGESQDEENNNKQLVNLNDFYISKFEVTHANFIEFLNELEVASDGVYEFKKYINIESTDCAIKHDGKSFYFKANKYAKSKNSPVFCVTWFGANAYCKWKGGRLPTEAEWEYTAKGGEKSQNYVYSGSNKCEEVAWFRNNSKGFVHKVGMKKPNELGIYDMNGNVSEWCNDWFSDNYIRLSTSLNPEGPDSGSSKVVRGGSWYDRKSDISITKRKSLSPFYGYNRYGFRVVKENHTR